NILERLDNPKHHKPIERDIYGSGQFFKLCDVLYVKVLPWRMHLQDKFMVFSSEAYNWLEDFKIDNGNNSSFDPIGIAYYFYLKRRGTDIKDMQDVYAERIFKKDEAKGITPKVEIASPSFQVPIFEKEAPIEPNFDLKGAFDDTDNPF